MTKRNRKIKLATLLVVGEGPNGKGFLEHLKSIYDHRNTGQNVKIISADGGSPKDIIRSAFKSKHADYDRRIVLMDSDIELSQEDWQLAKKKGVQIIQSKPICLEGMLLDAVGEKAPRTNEECKKRLHKMLSGHPSNKNSYSKLLPKEFLDSTKKQQLMELRKILSNTDG